MLSDMLFYLSDDYLRTGCKRNIMRAAVPCSQFLDAYGQLVAKPRTPPPHVKDHRSCIVVHLPAVVGQDIFVSCLYENYVVLAVDTPITNTELQLAKTDDHTFVNVAVPTQGTPCRQTAVD